MIGNIIRQNKHGLTLVELLIVLTIFSLTAFLAMSIIMMYLGAQGEILAKQSLENDLRSMIESMVHDVHETMIDYDHYDAAGLSLDDVMSELALVSKKGDGILYQANEIDPGKFQLFKNGENMESNKIYLEKIEFYIQPAENPWEKYDLAGAYVYENTQPYVTIFLRGVTESNKGEINTVDIQTTVTSRYYAR